MVSLLVQAISNLSRDKRFKLQPVGGLYILIGDLNETIMLLKFTSILTEHLDS
jgi:hypothetical protein